MYIERLKAIERCEELNKYVEEYTGISIKGIKSGNRGITEAKQMFWRQGFLDLISGTVLSEFTGNHRYSAATGRSVLVDRCKKRQSYRDSWEKFRELVKSKDNDRTREII